MISLSFPKLISDLSSLACLSILSLTRENLPRKAQKDTSAAESQKQIEDKTGIPQPTVSKIERGETKDVLSKNYRALVSLHASMSGQLPVEPEAAHG